jgi:hypothetical protein
MTDRGKSFDDMSLKELCAPLSGTKHPEAAFAAWFGKPGISEARILGNQRAVAANARNRKVKKARAKREGSAGKRAEQ